MSDEQTPSTEPLPFEEAETRARIFERLEGKQVAWFLPQNDRNPFGGAMMGMEFTDGVRIVFMAVPDLTDGSTAPWRIRPTLIEDANLIWSPKTLRHFKHGREKHEKPGWVQERVEGEVLVACHLLPEITNFGGEQLAFMFRNHTRMLMRACPMTRNYTANIALFLFDRDGETIKGPRGPLELDAPPRPHGNLVVLPGGKTT